MNFSSILSKISRSILAQRSEKGGEEDFRREWHNSRPLVLCWFSHWRYIGISSAVPR
jgi:hypothetical protein